MLSTRVDRAPRFTAADAAELAARYFGVNGRAKMLPSERDQNFRLTTTDGIEFVLKIANAGEDRAVLEMQNRAMDAVTARAPSLCPRVCPSLQGDSIVTHPANGTPYALRLLSYVPGRPLAAANPRTPGLVRSVGALLGRLDQALAGFEHVAAHRRFQWDLALAEAVVDRNIALLAPDQRPDIESVLARYRAHVVPRLPRLRQSVIHSDGNDYNILVVPDADWHLQAGGVIDFGDMVYSHTVNEVAIAGAYAMLGTANPLPCALALVEGYHDAYPLTEDEADVAYDLMCMRLAVSVCLAAEQSAAAPDNDYLLVSQAQIRDLLTALRAVPPDLARAAMRHACGYAPVAHAPRVLDRLSAVRCTGAPILADDAGLLAAPVLDLAVDSHVLTPAVLQRGAAGLAEIVAALCHASGSRYAVGRYGEARLYDTTFALPASPEMHPGIQLGLDLFAPTGTPVHAPLAGEVVGIKGVASGGRAALLLQHRTDAGDTFYTLYRGLDLAGGEEMGAGRAFAAGDRLGSVAGAPPHLHVQLVLDHFGLGVDFPQAIEPDGAPFWQTVAPNPAPLLGLEPAAVEARSGRACASLLADRQRHLPSNLSISYANPLKIVRGLGQYLYDEQGRAYLDVVNNVCHVGHCHPHVVAAGQQQMAVLNTNTRYLHDNLVDYAERLLAKFPAQLSVVFFVCSGSEANELALRLARTYTERRDVIMLDAAYHGNTQALVDISPYKHDGPGGRGAPSWAHAAAMPDPYRGPHKGYGTATGVAYAEDIGRMVLQLGAEGRSPAALITETVLGCGGQVVLPQGYLAAAYEHVRSAGGVCIADEVQVGFGRVGSHFWGWETQAVVPDIVTMGKPIGNGHPLAAVVTTRAIADAFANGMEYFNTFGGNPVSCAIGNAVLDVIEREQLQENARVAGARLISGLNELKERYPLIGDVRGLGLFVGVELVEDRTTLAPAARQASYIANRMRDHGILISTDGPLHNVLKMKPPIVFTTADADRLVATLDCVLAEDCLQP